jgi:hypothetical protein
MNKEKKDGIGVRFPFLLFFANCDLFHSSSAELHKLNCTVGHKNTTSILSLNLSAILSPSEVMATNISQISQTLAAEGVIFQLSSPHYLPNIQLSSPRAGTSTTF